MQQYAVKSQNLNKEIVNIADKNLTDYSFLCKYNYTKSKNYFKRRYRSRHWIPMFIGTPCTIAKLIEWWIVNITICFTYLTLHNVYRAIVFLEDERYLSTKLSNICSPHCLTPFLKRKNHEIDEFHKISPRNTITLLI